MAPMSRRKDARKRCNFREQMASREWRNAAVSVGASTPGYRRGLLAATVWTEVTADFCCLSARVGT
jgi:hypothetical protein